MGSCGKGEGRLTGLTEVPLIGRWASKSVVSRICRMMIGSGGKKPRGSREDVE